MRRARGVARRAPGVVGLVLAAACVGEGRSSDASLSREEFVEVYVALRAAGLQSASGVISPGDRERILTERGIEQEELIEFADAHGGDPAFMKDLWDEVESRLEERRSGTDAAR